MKPFFLFVAFLTLLSFAGSAAGLREARGEEDDAPSAVSQLTAEERAILEARIEGWTDLDTALREKIARNVIRLRSLSEEERQRLERRIGALEGHRRRHGRMPDAVRGLRDRPGLREEMRRWGLLVHAAGARLEEALPEAERERLEERLQGRERATFDRVFFQAWWGRRVERMLAQERIEVPEEVPAAKLERFEDLRGRADAGDERARRMLAYFVLGHRTGRLTASIDPESLRGDPAALLALGARLRAEDPEAFDAAVAEAREALADDAALERYLERGRWGRMTGWGRGRGEPLRRLREALDEAWPVLEADPDLREAAAALRGALAERMGRGPGRRGRGPHHGPR